MPMTSKGLKIFNSMIKEYGPKKAKNVFYGAENDGRIKGVTADGPSKNRKKKKNKAA